MSKYRTAEILLVEDNLGDIELTKEAFQEAEFQNNLSVATDGQEAINILFKNEGYETSQRPDVIILDLNMPITNGKEVLMRIKQDESLRVIPVVVFTSSRSASEIEDVYNMHANCCIMKPNNTDDFIQIVNQVKNYWTGLAVLPKNRTIN